MQLFNRKFLQIEPNKRKIAYHWQEQIQSQKPAIIWLGGFMSNMESTKAQALKNWSKENNFSFLCFDYHGHGQSSGKLIDSTISIWLEDSLAIINHIKPQKMLLVGSSLGGWLALLITKIINKYNYNPIKGIILIAPAIDFTEDLIFKNISKIDKDNLEEKGFFLQPSEDNNNPYIITKQLIEDGRKHLIFTKPPMRTFCKVQIIHGIKDETVPWQYTQKLSKYITLDPLNITYVQDGDHRLSTPQNLQMLFRIIEKIITNN